MKFLPNIINNDQTGFLKNRFIGENIRLIESIINHTDMEQIPGLLSFVDFEKAFDSIEWSFIEKTLTHFNFGTSLVSYFILFYWIFLDIFWIGYFLFLFYFIGSQCCL